MDEKVVEESITSCFKGLASEVSISEEFANKELKQRKIEQMHDSQLRPKLLFHSSTSRSGGGADESGGEPGQAQESTEVGRSASG